MDSATDNAGNPAHDAKLETPLDTALRQHFQNEPEPADDGFTLRVMAVLPPAAARGHTRWRERAAYTRWTAISFGACAAAALLSGGQEPVDFAHSLAAYVLLGLLIFWSIPHRFNRV